MQEILIIGGLGFVGSALAKSYCEKNVSVTILDDKSNSLHETVDGCDTVVGAALNIGSYFKPEKFDAIFHLGEYSRVEQSFEDEEIVIKNNRNSFYEVLRFAAKCKAKLIYSASSTRFSDGGAGKFMSPYALTKYQNVEFLNAYAKWHDLPYAIAYFNNVYGPGENASPKYGTVVAKFRDLFVSGQNEFPVTAPGTQRRFFTHIEDTINALTLIAANGNGEGYQISSDKSYSILEVVELFGGNPVLQPARRGNRSNADIDTTKTRGLGWKPEKTLPDFINDFKSRHS